MGSSNRLYNLADAGNFLTGMALGGAGYIWAEIKVGTNVNEFYKLGDAAADQRAIKAGFGYKIDIKVLKALLK